MKLRSFKEPPPNIPLPPRTPSPIHHLVEPLTPTYPTAHKDGPLSAANDFTAVASAAAKHASTLINGRGGQVEGLGRDHNNIERVAHPSRPTHTRQNRGSSRGSSIAELAVIASSLAPSQGFAQPATNSLQPHASPRSTTRPFANGPHHGYTASDGQSYWPTHGYNHGYSDGNALGERPSKRARSDAGYSQQYQGTARPATSHNPSSNWSYNSTETMPGAVHASYASPTVNPEDFDTAQTLVALRSGSIDLRSIAALETQVSRDGFPRWREVPAPLVQSSFQNVGLVDGHQARPHRHSITTYQPEPQHPVVDAIEATPTSQAPPKMQTHTPPEDVPDLVNTNNSVEQPPPVEGKKGKSHQGWPKGKPRGPRNKGTSKKTSKAANKTAELVAAPPKEQGIDQLQSPQSLNEVPPGSASTERKDIPPTRQESEIPQKSVPVQTTTTTGKRRNSFPDSHGPDTANPAKDKLSVYRAASVPPDNNMVIKDSSFADPLARCGAAPKLATAPAREETICAGCNFSRGPSTGQNEQWMIECDGCHKWFHFACAGFRNAKEVSSIDKFHCRSCKPKFGPTTFVRKSKRAHTAVDYAGLHEGVLRTSEDEYEHHYIRPIKDGTFTFQPETFPRMRPELLTAAYLEKSGGFREPIVIPACWNPRPNAPGADVEMTDVVSAADHDGHDEFYDDVEYETTPDDGQDLLDMVIPAGLTVPKVAELYGPEEKVEVIDVKSQESQDKWTMAKWAAYYEEDGEKPVRNVISLEFSQSRLARLVRRPKVVRDLDLQDSVWPQEEAAKGIFPKVQFYCLMSVADSYTDFHIDFGGSSVFYHIIKGKKTFFFIPPKKQHLMKYEKWCSSETQNHTFLAHDTKECYRVDLSEGDTMLIPSGWIHAVWTPANSLVIGGNFLTRLNYGMQIRVAEVEKNTKVPRKFRYPHFQKVLWYAVLQYLQLDPLPSSVLEQLSKGEKFSRSTPIYLEPDKFGHNSDPGPENYNARYYSKSELEGLPDLVNYIFRTVRISHGCVENEKITQEVRNAVTKSIPKGHGKPILTVKTFAMWVAWKRGNEDIPQWAHLDAELPNIGASGVKKLSNAALKQLERQTFIENYRTAPERAQSARLRTKALEGDSTDDASSVKHTSSPKTSVLGPKRIACDACRKRRIRCKHKDEVMSPVATKASTGERRPSAPIVPVMMPVPLNAETAAPLNGVPPQNVNGHLPAAITSDIPNSTEIPESKQRRSKACLDCRRSKRRCIHDENGNVDPIKAQELPVPRGRRRVSGGDETDGPKTSRFESGLNFEQQGIYPPPEHEFASDHHGVIVPDAYPQLQPEEPSDIAMVDAHPVEAQPEPQPPLDAMNSVIDPMLESYTQGTIDEEVDQIQVNGSYPVGPNSEAKPPVSGDVAIPSTERVYEIPMAPMVPMAPMASMASTKRYPALDAGPSHPVSPHAPNGVQQSSPLTELGNSMSPEQPRMEMPIDPALDSPLERRQSMRSSRPVERYSETAALPRQSQPSKSRRTSSRTPAPAKSPSISGTSVKTPNISTPARQRRSSNTVMEFVDTSGSGGKKTVNSEPRQRPLSQVESPVQDQASLRLIREMMTEDRGLRRRGSR